MTEQTKKRLHNSLNVSNIIAVLALLLSLVLFLHRPKTEYIPATQNDSTYFKEAQHYKDLNGQLVAKLQQEVIGHNELQKKFDSVSKLLKIKPGTIKEVERHTLYTDIPFTGVPTPIVIGMDSVYTFSKEDQWVNVKGIFSKNLVTLNIEHRDSLLRVVTVKNKWFKPDEVNVILKNASPYSKITSGYSFSEKVRGPDLTIGPYIGYDFFTKKPSFGISIQKPIIKIKFHK